VVTDLAMFLVSSPFFCVRGLGGESGKFLAACLHSGPLEFLRVGDVNKTYERIPRSRDVFSWGVSTLPVFHSTLGFQFNVWVSIPRSVFNLTFGFPFNVWFSF